MYDFPIQDNTRVFYQDSLTKDIDRLNYLSHTIHLQNEYPNFDIVYDGYSLKIEEIIKGLRGFHYTEEEINIAIKALSEVQDDLHTLIDDRDFSGENKQDREKILDVLNHFIESLTVLEKY